MLKGASTNEAPPPPDAGVDPAILTATPTIIGTTLAAGIALAGLLMRSTARTRHCRIQQFADVLFPQSRVDVNQDVKKQTVGSWRRVARQKGQEGDADREKRGRAFKHGLPAARRETDSSRT